MRQILEYYYMNKKDNLRNYSCKDKNMENYEFNAADFIQMAIQVIN